VIRPLPLLGLVAVYLLTLTSVDPLDAAGGLVVGAAALLYVRRLLDDGPRLEPLGRRLVHAPRFAWGVLRELVSGTLLVLGVVLGLRERRQGIVAIPLGDRTDIGVAVSALALNLSPGEVMLDVDWERRVMYIHVLDAADPDAVRRRHAEFYERDQRGLFP